MESVSSKFQSINWKKIVKKIIDIIWLPLIPILIGSIFLLIGLMNNKPYNLSNQGFSGNWATMFRVSGWYILSQGLPLFIAVTFSLNFVKTEKGVAVLSGLIGYVVFIGVIAGLLHLYESDAHKTELFQFKASDKDRNNYLANFHWEIGKWTLATGIPGGIIIGLLSALIQTFTYKAKMPKILGFFAGVRFTPIMVCLISMMLSLATFFIWYYGILPNIMGWNHA